MLQICLQEETWAKRTAWSIKGWKLVVYFANLQIFRMIDVLNEYLCGLNLMVNAGRKDFSSLFMESGYHIYLSKIRPVLQIPLRYVSKID